MTVPGVDGFPGEEACGENPAGYRMMDAWGPGLTNAPSGPPP